MKLLNQILRINRILLGALFFLTITKLDANAATNIRQTSIAQTSASIKWSAEAEEKSFEVYAWIPQLDWNGKKMSIYYDKEYIGSTTDDHIKIKNLVGGYNSRVLVRSFDEDGDYVSDALGMVETLPGKTEIDKVAYKWGSYAATSSDTNLTADMTFNLYADIIAQEDVDGYELQVFTFKNKKVKTLSKKQSKSSVIRFPVYNLKDFGYYVKARAYKTYNGKKYYSAWSAKFYALRQPRSQAKPNGETLMVRWEKVEGATGYDVYLSEQKDADSFVKVSSVGKNVSQITVNKLKKKKFEKGKEYYFYVFAKKKVSGEIYVSARSYKLFKVKF